MTARLAVHVVGPLQSYRDGFAEAMRLEGYAEGPVELHSHLLAHLSRWLLERGLGASDLTPPVIEEFFAGRRARRRWLATTRAAQPLLRYLRAMGAGPEEVEQPPVTAADELAGAFGSWLVCDRGLAAASVELYVRWARHLTARWWQGGGVVPEDLDPATIIALVRDEVERLAAPSARNLLGALRSFLRFLYVTGRTSRPLVAAVPAAAVWRGPQLPRAVPRPVAEDLLESCDQTTPGGRRDLAVLRLLLRLGLRAGEVAGLELDSIDWRAGEIVVEGKSRRPERLPLPVDVGEAIAAYLRDGRPRITGRGVFLQARAPHGALSRYGVRSVVYSACDRCGVPRFGPHRLRHTLGTETLRAGASLPEVAQLLRHRSLDATETYAKVDDSALRELAMTWPGSAR
jgi:integrase/recombinase XerD